MYTANTTMLQLAANDDASGRLSTIVINPFEGKRLQQ